MTKSSTSIWHLLHNVKSTVKTSLIFVAFSENINFTEFYILTHFSTTKTYSHGIRRNYLIGMQDFVYTQLLIYKFDPKIPWLTYLMDQWSMKRLNNIFPHTLYWLVYRFPSEFFNSSLVLTISWRSCGTIHILRQHL